MENSWNDRLLQVEFLVEPESLKSKNFGKTKKYRSSSVNFSKTWLETSARFWCGLSRYVGTNWARFEEIRTSTGSETSKESFSRNCFSWKWDNLNFYFLRNKNTKNPSVFRSFLTICAVKRGNSAALNSSFSETIWESTVSVLRAWTWKLKIVFNEFLQ